MTAASVPSTLNSQLLKALCLLAVILLTLAMVDRYLAWRTRPAGNSCINNLRQLHGAKQQWALENHQPTNAVPTRAYLSLYLGSWTVCPQGGTYTIGPVSALPTCTIPAHKLPAID